MAYSIRKIIIENEKFRMKNANKYFVLSESGFVNDVVPLAVAINDAEHDSDDDEQDAGDCLRSVNFFVNKDAETKRVNQARVIQNRNVCHAFSLQRFRQTHLPALR